MTHPKTLVFGAAGKTGGAVAMELLERGRPVRALVRRDDERARDLARKGAEIAVADMHAEADIAAAVADVRQVYWSAPFDPQAVRRQDV